MILTNADIRVSGEQLRFTDCVEKPSLDDMDRSVLRLAKLLK